MAKRFDQYCPIAHAMSLVGERWALLIVRDLMKGPRRYTDLAAGLPGIGTNVLATRLRELEAAGVVERRKLPPPAASTVYELTPYGAELDEALHALARWGARSLGPPRCAEDLEPEWGLNAFPALLYPERAKGVTETYVIRVGDDVFTLRVDDGALRADVGPADDADVEMTTDVPTFMALAAEELAPEEAVEQGRLFFEGDPEARDRFFRIFSFAPRRATVARGDRVLV